MLEVNKTIALIQELWLTKDRAKQHWRVVVAAEAVVAGVARWVVVGVAARRGAEVEEDGEERAAAGEATEGGEYKGGTAKALGIRAGRKLAPHTIKTNATTKRMRYPQADTTRIVAATIRIEAVTIRIEAGMIRIEAGMNRIEAAMAVTPRAGTRVDTRTMIAWVDITKGIVKAAATVPPVATLVTTKTTKATNSRGTRVTATRTSTTTATDAGAVDTEGGVDGKL